MKLFKIFFISIISILIFQSQLYGINLSCDFQQRLFGINDKEFNGVVCGWGVGKSICKVQDSGERKWISEIIIKNKDVVIMYELNNYDRGSYTNQQKRDWREREKERVFKVENVVHHKTIYDEKVFMERYIVVINETVGEKISKLMGKEEGDDSWIYKVGLYTLFFDNLSKQSILTEYISFITPMNNKTVNWTTSYYGECEIE